MQIIKLPRVLPGKLDLAEINGQLKSRSSSLDWSGVEVAADKYLAILLAGLDLAADEDVLGVEGEIEDSVASDIARYFAETSTNVANQSAIEASPTSPSKESVVSSEMEVVLTSEADTIGSQNTEVLSSQATIDPLAPVENEATQQTLPLTSSNKVLTIPSPYEIRAELEQLILNDLLGPAGGENEEINEAHVSDRYLVGILAPLHRKNDVDHEDNEEKEDNEELAIGGQDTAEEGTADNTIAAAKTMMPSSFGMTFCVSQEATAIRILASWGKYDRGFSETFATATGNPKKVWQRQTVKGRSVPITLREGHIATWVVDDRFQDVYVQGLMRKHHNDWIVSIFLINGQRETRESGDAMWLFQPKLMVESADPNMPDIFVRRPRLDSTLAAEQADNPFYLEEEAMNMVYRNQLEFAIGHGTSVYADKGANPERAIRINSTAIPAYEVPKVTPPTVEEIPDLAGLVLDMKELATMPVSDLAAKLNPLTVAYERWITEQRQHTLQPEQGLTNFQAVAQGAINNCNNTLARIREGIELLTQDPKAAESFQFMNLAMWRQRIRSLFSEKKRRNQEVTLAELDITKNRTWFTFQLAFILLNLPSITKLDHEDRCHQTNAIADLLWFPTGGGKTEAYLGLTAYTLALRRRQGTIAGRSGEYGVAVLMRYTLRLLTLQQFQRATTLICACEDIRREAIRQGDSRWGTEPFRVGLWVGSRTTPNKTTQSNEKVSESKVSYQAGIGSPHQLTNCPWCGTKIEKNRHIEVRSFEAGEGRTLVYCGDSLGRCLFSAKNSPGEGLPVVVVDEEIYRRLPSLLISTVDKFAQMAWNGATQMLFGQVEAYCERHGFKSSELEDSNHNSKGSRLATKLVPHTPLRPPDLIIQDELHLISGPLGTLVGLYETAVDKLASWEVNGKLVRPKVIASTATIRQAQEQVQNLFLRKVQIFPPQGLDIGDNFFARQRVPSEETPGRRYLGICAPGRRLTATLIRVYVAILAAAETLYDQKYGEAVDPWMTLVGYFNSLRELAGMRRRVDDNIRSRLSRMERRGLANRYIRHFEELTSRKNSTDIPEILDKLEMTFSARTPKDLAKKSLSSADKERLPLDILLATNMLSVGVDVKRLGIMVVANQPKNTAEYIQATSRVGRAHPGLVFTVYNWARPRDLSHYESFEHYHSTFYKHVEALSVTPFAPGAVERGLASVLVALVRLLGKEFNSNTDAGSIQQGHPYIKEAIETIANRAWLIGNLEISNYVRLQLNAKVDSWLARQNNASEQGFKLGYKKRDGMTIGLLKDPALEWDTFTCLQSLRNVEPTVNLLLDSRFLDYEPGRLPQGVADSPEIQEKVNADE